MSKIITVFKKIKTWYGPYGLFLNTVIILLKLIGNLAHIYFLLDMWCVICRARISMFLDQFFYNWRFNFLPRIWVSFVRPPFFFFVFLKWLKKTIIFYPAPKRSKIGPTLPSWKCQTSDPCKLQAPGSKLQSFWSDRYVFFFFWKFFIFSVLIKFILGILDMNKKYSWQILALISFI